MAIDFKRHKPPAPVIELTSLIDIIFQLLIFFMLSSSFIQPSLEIQLPVIQEPNTPITEARWVLSLNAEGQLFLGETQLPSDQLKTSLQQKISEEGLKPLFFQADKNIPYEQVLEALHSVGQAGVTQLNFVYEPA